MIKIVLVDDHQYVRQGLKELLEAEPDIEVIGEAGSGREGIEMARQLRPDVILSDLMMKTVDGIQLVREVALCSRETRTIIVSVHNDAGYVARALREGARGYVLKESGIDILVKAVRQVMDGQVYLCPALAGDSTGPGGSETFLPWDDSGMGAP
jgi:two-component system response regulator DegU